jgi:zinc protease
LFEHILANVKTDKDAYANMVDGILKDRADAKLSKGAIMYSGLLNYGKYGAEAPNKHLLSANELKNIDVNNLIKKIKELTSYEHYVYYFGTKEQAAVKAIINKYHKTPQTLKPLIPAKEFVELPTEQNKVYFVNYDMVQTEMMMLSKVKTFTNDELPFVNLFNEYFGRGLSSIVFQEIREAKALAYSAYTSYTVPRKPNRAHYVQAYIGTQVDKLNDAANAMLELMNNMPEVNDQFNGSKLAALKQIETSRTKQSSLFWKYLSAKDMGRNYDINKDIYPKIEKMELKDLKAFFDQNIKNRTYNFLVIGNNTMVNKDVLKSLGEYKELTLEELFGY